MVSKVVITKFAQKQFREYIEYILNRFKNRQAATAVREDAKLTKARLLDVAESLKYCDDPVLCDLGYKTIHFGKHDYFFVYSVTGDVANIEAVYHDLQDYENLFKSEILNI